MHSIKFNRKAFIPLRSHLLFGIFEFCVDIFWDIFIHMLTLHIHCIKFN